MSNYDIGIIGAGVAGAFAASKLANENTKTILFDLGRPPMKRRRQLEGWLGCLPNSDGKLYLNDINKVSAIVGNKKAKSAYSLFEKTLSKIDRSFKVTKDKSPSVSLDKKIKKNGYNIQLNDYIQIYPKDIHSLSKYMSECLEQSNNITYSFDNEVKHIYKNKDMFTVVTEVQEYKCKKLLISVGRSGWRWAQSIYNNFGIIDNNDFAKFGIRIEMNSSYLKDFNKSNCTLTKDDIEIGPLSWYGTVIPEDHIDLAISAFRANENRWKSDKVSFTLIGNRPFTNNGFEQTDRIGKLTFILTNDRILRERVHYIMNGKSKISIIPEYDWLKNPLEDLSNLMPELLNKAYFHVPTIMPIASKINIGNNLSSEVENMFVAGESAGITGILSAALTGLIAADSLCK